MTTSCGLKKSLARVTKEENVLVGEGFVRVNLELDESHPYYYLFLASASGRDVCGEAMRRKVEESTGFQVDLPHRSTWNPVERWGRSKPSLSGGIIRMPIS